MPQVDLKVKNPQLERRVELGLCLSEELFDIVAKPDYIWHWLAHWTIFPWRHNTFLGHCHSIAEGSVSDVFPQTRIAGAILSYNPLGAPEIDLPVLRNDQVRVLWLALVTEAELEFSDSKSVSKLRDMLVEANIGWQQNIRESVV